MHGSFYDFPCVYVQIILLNWPLHGFQGSIVDIYDPTRTPSGAYMVFHYELLASKTLVVCLFLIGTCIVTLSHYIVTSFPTVVVYIAKENFITCNKLGVIGLNVNKLN